MKKNYIQPRIETEHILTFALCAGSGPGNGSKDPQGGDPFAPSPARGTLIVSK